MTRFRHANVKLLSRMKNKARKQSNQKPELIHAQNVNVIIDCGCRVISSCRHGKIHGKTKIGYCSKHASVGNIATIEGLWDNGLFLGDKEVTITFQTNGSLVSQVYTGMIHCIIVKNLYPCNGTMNIKDVIQVYQGMIRHGHGKFRWNNGICDCSYIGEWQRDKMHGKGTLTMSDGNSYSGDWVDNVPHGHGRRVYANGDVYVGNFRNDKRHGSGEMTYTNSVLSGEWNDDNFVSKYVVDNFPTIYSVD